eukprot:5573282-Pleurochrysis_carterae.AAC.3
MRNILLCVPNFAAASVHGGQSRRPAVSAPAGTADTRRASSDPSAGVGRHSEGWEAARNGATDILTRRRESVNDFQPLLRLWHTV